MDAILKIEAALAKKPTAGNWKTRRGFLGCLEVFPSDVKITKPGHATSIVEVDDSYDEWRANAAYIAACNPAAIREVLQTLASKEAEVARLREALGDEKTAFYDGYGAAHDDINNLRAPAIQIAWDRRAALTPQPPKD